MDRSDGSRCPVCGVAKHGLAKLCPRCKRLVNRLDTRHRPDWEARVRALQEAWDGRGFRCHYSGVRLVEDDHHDPQYFTFDHRVPRDEHDVVVAAACINDMKSDLSDQEFRAVVTALPHWFAGGEFDSEVLRLRHWRRGRIAPRADCNPAKARMMSLL